MTKKLRSIREAVHAARILVFDFDGTLVDSNEVKWRGFEEVFADHPAHRDRISAYCRGSNHTIRGEKFRHVCENILGIAYTPEIERVLHERYAAITTRAVAEAPEIPGALEFLRRMKGRPMALLSSTPTAILIDILGRRGWTSFFERVQGAPIDKRAWLTDLERELGCGAASIVFFGDTDEDAVAAAGAPCVFVRVGAAAEFSIRDFNELNQ
jgi:phosphoglycolate phosphatase-like HAD superfamily hydrolase